jgi:hypothetical protein
MGFVSARLGEAGRGKGVETRHSCCVTRCSSLARLISSLRELVLEFKSFGKEVRGGREGMEMEVEVEVKSDDGYATPAESEPL